ncbi:MAG: peptidylprolyl isomerase [bacterium]
MNYQKTVRFTVTLFACACISLLLYSCHSSPTPGKGEDKGTTSSPAAPKEGGEKQSPSGQLQSPGDVVATVNGVNISRKELDRTLNAHTSQNPDMADKMPPEQKLQLQQMILDRLVEGELICQKGKELNITIPDEEILARIEQFKKQFPTEEEFNNRLKENNINLDDLKNELRKNMIISKVIQQQITAQTTSQQASDEDLKKYYEAHKDQFKQEEMVQASHILVKVEKNADEATKKQAKEKIEGILKKARAGEDFAKLAKENSDCPSSQNGGDLGFFTRKQMVPEFSQAAFSMKVGEISNVVETPFGYHIIKVTNTKPAAESSFEESKARIQQYLSGKQRSDAVKNYIQSLREKADIKTFLPKPSPAPENPATPSPGAGSPPAPAAPAAPPAGNTPAGQ